MQRGDAAVVLRVRICSFVDEVRDQLVLGIWITVDGAGTSICRVVNRFGSSSVPGAHICASHDEGIRKPWVVCGGGDVKCRVAGVEVMVNRPNEVRVRILAGRPEPNGLGGEGGCFVELSCDLPVIT